MRLRVLASERAAPSAHKPGLTQQSSEVKRQEPMTIETISVQPAAHFLAGVGYKLVE